MRYEVIETPCRPRRWKVKPVGWYGTNDVSNFFEYRGDAEAEAKRREARKEES